MKASISLLGALLLLSVSFACYAQLTGPTTPCVGTEYNYTFNNGNSYTGYTWVVTNGSIVSSSSNPPAYNVTVQWTSSGPGTLQFKWKMMFLGTLNVTVADLPPAPTGSFTYSGTCLTHTEEATTVITRTGTPPSGVEWYWQTSDTGTSLALGSQPTFDDVEVGHEYYLRAYNGTCWSSGALMTGFIPGPVYSTIDGEGCMNQQVSLSVTGPGSVTILWYDQCTGGQVVGTGLTFLTPPLTQTTTYYVAVLSYAGVESAREKVHATILPPYGPPVPLGQQSATTSSFSFGWQGSYCIKYDVSMYPTFAGGQSNVLACDAALPDKTTTVTGLYAGTTYYYRLRAYNSGQVTCTSANTAVLTGTTICYAPLAYPESNATSSSFIADWRAEYGAVSYLLEVSTSGLFEDPLEIVVDIPGKTDQLVENLQPEEDYYYRVRAVNAGGISAYSNIIGVDNQDHNYVRVVDLLTPKNTASSVDELINGLSVSEKEKTVKYDFFNGLGQLEQTVIKSQSPTFKDIVQPVVYDKYGLESVKYLPYASGSDGWFKPDFITRENPNYTDPAQSPQYNFYQSTPEVAVSAKPFAVTVFEQSPLKRPLEQGAPGESWQPDVNNAWTSPDHTRKYAYEFNGTDEVLKWSFTPSTDPQFLFGFVSAGTGPDHYSLSELIKIKTKDEDNNEVHEFKDKQGRVILKKVQINGSTFASTYSIYDNYGQLVCVIPPAAVDRLLEFYNEDTNAKETFLKRWTFRYKYDPQRRMTHKQLPAAEPLCIVYDKWDRPVMTQDGNRRQLNQWQFTKYDVLNRPIITGIYTDSSNPPVDQAGMSSLIGTTNMYETYNEEPATEGYTNNVFPTTGTSLLTVTYYDNYDFLTLWPGPYAYYNDGLAQLIGDHEYEQLENANTQVLGQATGRKVKVLDGGPIGTFRWLKTVNYYDDFYRVVQTKADNLKSGIDRESILVDFKGQALQKLTTHERQDVVWGSIVGTSVTDNVLRKSAAGTAWDSGAASTTQLPAGQDGWLEIPVYSINANRIIGLADTNPDANYTSIDYAFYLQGSVLKVYENGAIKATISGALEVGQVLRIERVGTSVRYLRNNAQVYPSTIPSSTSLMVDVSISGASGAFKGVRASFSSSSKTILRKMEHDHAGRLLSVRRTYDQGDEVVIVSNEYNELGQLVDKNLHSTNGTTYKQSVDSRYNIRGWLESINNPGLTLNSSNDDTGDFFGMELKYDALDAGFGNDDHFNGNIGGIKWSNYPGTGVIKEKGYLYSYDAAGRLSSADFSEKEDVWSTPTNEAYSEKGIQYDLNGNITDLIRKDRRESGSMDVLEYDYGNNGGNQLMGVTDSEDDFKGFLDGNTLGNDYAYDVNGNMTSDLNKGITSITYNILNLPDMVARGGNNVRYIYDATGRKLAQHTNLGGILKETDYMGDFLYENDVLQFVNHEEGRIVIATHLQAFLEQGEKTTAYLPNSSTLTAVTQNGGTYVKVTANSGSNRGVFITPPIAATGGEKYRIRVKGYSTGSNTASIIARANGNNIDWPGSNLPNSLSVESWIEQVVTIPPSGTTLEVGVRWPTAVQGETMYINELEVIRIGSGTPEYQYFLKDHLGNVRVTFTSKESVTASYSTDFEGASSPDFQNYTAITTYDLVDHTDPADVYQKVQWLNGGINGRTGLAKSFAVMPGDEVSISSFCKYMNLGTAPNPNGFITSLAAAFGVSSSSTGELGKIYDGLEHYATVEVPNGDHYEDNENAPKVFATILFFDKDYNLVDAAWDQVTTTGVQVSGSIKEPPHDLLSVTKKAPAAGYAFVFLSNEHPTFVDVYFDDVTATLTPSPIVQVDDYYPFGLTFNSASRENSLTNVWKFQGQENVVDLGLNWDSFKWRNHQPELGRFFGLDPLAEKYFYNSPYAFSENLLVAHRELEGCESQIAVVDVEDLQVKDDKKDTQQIRQTIEKAGGTNAYVMNKVQEALPTPTVAVSGNVDAGPLTDVKIFKNFEGHSFKPGATELVSGETKWQPGKGWQGTAGGIPKGEVTAKTEFAIAKFGAMGQYSRQHTKFPDGGDAITQRFEFSYFGFGFSRSNTSFSDGSSEQTTRFGFSLSGGAGKTLSIEGGFFMGLESKSDDDN